MFAGYGGLDLAVEEAFGATTAWVSEVDKGPSKILAARFPHAPNHGDVTKINWADVDPVDIITGGSPCQDLSHAGKRAGMKAGTRSGLWASMCDAIETIRPHFVVWENVRGALSAEATAGDVESCEFCMDDRGGPSLRALGRVLGDLAELGYDAAWCGLRAADVGAPHGRFRVFVLAWDTTRPTGLDGRPAVPDADGTARGERRFAAPGQAQGGRSRADASRRGGAPAPDLTLLPTPVVNDMGRAYTPETWDEWTTRLKASHGNGNGHGASLSIEALRMLPTPEASRAGGTAAAHLERKRKADGSTRTQVTNLDVLANDPRSDFGAYAPAIERWERVFGRPAPSPTEPTGKGGAQRLSPRFVEWLMGLPDGWVTDTDITRNEQLKALGNGVVPQQAAAAIRHMLHTINFAEEAVA
ncbi:DNA cytosine methyltransferase [Oerskovia sp. Root22]|uniref:DNA cytosine methyltransferase n=1 Tax=Oerskovia sp. Root22 TaxID=1736494 RepID=UPI0019107BA8|nr:DNA (cytosine-5-)-methyltransferase [Oerskovia sp. Root22]